MVRASAQISETRRPQWMPVFSLSGVHGCLCTSSCRAGGVFGFQLPVNKASVSIVAAAGSAAFSANCWWVFTITAPLCWHRASLQRALTKTQQPTRSTQHARSLYIQGHHLTTETSGRTTVPTEHGKPPQTCLNPPIWPCYLYLFQKCFFSLVLCYNVV